MALRWWPLAAVRSPYLRLSPPTPTRPPPREPRGSRCTGQRSALVSLEFGSTASANGQSEISPRHSISDDGKYLVFISTGSNLVDSQSNPDSTQNVYLYNTETEEITLISHTASSETTGGDAASFNPVISGDGSTVAFFSMATNLTNLSGDFAPTEGTVQLYLYDVDDGDLTDTPAGGSRRAAARERDRSLAPLHDIVRLERGKHRVQQHVPRAGGRVPDQPLYGAAGGRAGTRDGLDSRDGLPVPAAARRRRELDADRMGSGPLHVWPESGNYAGIAPQRSRISRDVKPA